MNSALKWCSWVVVSCLLVWACGSPSAAEAPGKACETDADCPDPTACQTGTCNLTAGECEYSLKENYCFIGADDDSKSCHVEGELDGDDQCKVCNPTESVADWVAVACDTNQICVPDQGCVGSEQACGTDDTLCDTGNPCITGSCLNGLCEQTVQTGEVCDDNDACTSDDQCGDDGTCAGTFSCDCQQDSDCPVKSCHTVVCDDSSCTYTEEADATACDDGDACTEDDACAAGACMGTAMICDGGDSCNSPVCVDGNCTTEQQDPGTDCDDANDCTKGDACDAAGLCIGQWDDQTCDCQSTADCKAVPPQCQQYTCTGGQCALEPGTDDVACDDADACTSGEVCTAGDCGGGAAVTCADTGNPCTENLCSAKNGCETFDVDASGVSCDDANDCTSGDECDGKGGCAGAWDYGICECQQTTDCKGTAPQCQQYVCESGGGACVLQNADGVFCDDGDACTEGESCAAGSCGGGTTKSCPDDNNACTFPVCDSSKGCGVENYGPSTTCNDGNICTGDGYCDGGSCQDGAAVNCTDNDNNPCTVPACDASQGGCVETNQVGLQCMASNACVELASCNANAECEIDSYVTCPDTNNSCTTSTCDINTPLVGCEQSNINQNGVCGASSICVNGQCTLQQCVQPSDCDPDNTSCATWLCTGFKCVQDKSMVTGTPCGKSGSGQLCIQGQCKTPQCTADKNCDGDPCKVFACENYNCVQKQSLVGGVCGDKKTCITGVCTSVECTSNTHCDVDPCKVFECKSNECVQTQSIVGGSCGKNKTCVGGVCTDKQCNTASDCSPNSCTKYTCSSFTYQCQSNGFKAYGSACKVGKLNGTCSFKGTCNVGGFNPKN